MKLLRLKPEVSFSNNPVSQDTGKSLLLTHNGFKTGISAPELSIVSPELETMP